MSAALTFSNVLHSSVPIWTDCQAVQTRTKEALSHRRRALGTKPQGIFYECLATTALKQRPIQWTRSHPERRTQDQSNWTYTDHGIYIADAAASGDWKTLDKVLGASNYSVVTTDATHILEEFFTTGQWHWRRYDTHLLTDLGPMLEETSQISTTSETSINTPSEEIACMLHKNAARPAVLDTKRNKAPSSPYP